MNGNTIDMPILNKGDFILANTHKNILVIFTRYPSNL